MLALGTIYIFIRGGGSFQFNSEYLSDILTPAARFLITLTVVAKNMQAQNPQIFGPYGGSSRVFAIIEMCFGAGMMVGPMFTGPITEKAGYYYMTLTLGMFYFLESIHSFNC